MAKVNEEMAGRTFTRGELSSRLHAFRRGQAEIEAIAAAMLDELAAAIEVLDGIAFPFLPSELGLKPEDVMLPFRNIRLLRRRYSTFDLAYDLGLESEMQETGRRCVGL
jgi:hypothetical protein